MTQSTSIFIEWEAGDPDAEPDARIAWALEFLQATATDRGLTQTSGGAQANHRIVMSAPGGALAAQVGKAASAPNQMSAESFALARLPVGDSEALVVAAGDPVGAVYALLELSDIVRCADSPTSDLSKVEARYQRPHVAVRSMSRMFTSHRIDSAWFHDRDFWDEYLTELALHRFNRFSLGFGLGYDYLIDKRVTDNYLCFLYPFVVSVPGYDVDVAGLTDEQRQRNLESLRYIARAASRRGIEFSLGLWNHAYRLDPVTPSEKWLISGLDQQNHAAYCSDALEMLLRECPEIGALTFRVHFEGGIPEPTHDFWRVVTGALAKVDRPIRLDAHAKGVNDELLEVLGSHGAPFTLSTKYWGEHMGLPYRQASIRSREFGARGSGAGTGHHERNATGVETTRQRSFTRYGYADYARDDARYGILHRVWPGTQRTLLWGDPAMAAGIGRQATFAGAEGIEWFEPLTFLGKKDSASYPLADDEPRSDRELYADPQLCLPGTGTWKKYLYTLRLLGRLSYDPAADPESWRRYLRSIFGAGTACCEGALGAASRILPLVMTVHAPSVAGNIYWPEMYTNIPMVAVKPRAENPFADFGWQMNAEFDMTPPYTFGNTSTLDPELFATVDEYADSLLDGEPTAKYSPIEVADWLQSLAQSSLDQISSARLLTDPTEPDFRRLEVDVRVLAHIGLFFAQKFRAGVAWRLHERTADQDSLESALSAYRSARDAWKGAADAADVYLPDLPFGRMPYQRGHWADRLAAINDDIAALATHATAEDCVPHADRRGATITSAPRIQPECGHVPPADFVKGELLTVALTASARCSLQVRAHYRHVDQSASWIVAPMAVIGDRFTIAIPADFTDGPYSIQYYFEVQSHNGTSLHPGLEPVNLSNQPYYVVHANPDLGWGR